MALVAAWTNGEGDFFSFLGRLVGSWARIALTPSGLMPDASLRILASSSISWTSSATRRRCSSTGR